MLSSWELSYTLLAGIIAALLLCLVLPVELSPEQEEDTE